MAYTTVATCLIGLWGRDTTQHREFKHLKAAAAAYRRECFADAASRSNYSHSSAAEISGALTLAGCWQTGFVCQT